ncbi:monosaccharide ABC transporter ATP-binding protein (CUT2 family) [Neorhizobium sp. R1-B]|jgi:ribose transport system ATP-binding protein|uniref:sugar ABC transporter ATP-binding protein n=1 Tax=Neorhizobium sp. R1-B TaxID=2485162 RepID=UPI0010EC7F36|nr:sugar ABC transporter ATP-binding protein [Neorhizobium sp. R1-B]TDX85212.1 monosaccharide ABC transporter ATP-binding protein (CUT2 family) [Neorhizobium sp. R1-B]
MMTKEDPKRPLLVLENISKAYTGVVALCNVSITVMAGEVLALIGENGAGKSTLMKILGGVVQPSSGHIIIDGVRCDGFSVTESQSAGIAFVHQELNVFDNLDVAANMFLGREIRKGFLRLLDVKAMRAAAEPLLRRVGATFEADTPVAALSLAERQLLEIAKALSIKARIIIMDEPTSSLTLSETKTLMSVVASLKAEGIAVIYISHRLSEIEECADRVFALRDGKAAGELCRAEIHHDAMIRMMIGRDLHALYSPPSRPAGGPILSLKAVRTRARPRALVDFDIHDGEILGMAGLVGAGRTELAEAIFGIDAIVEGQITLAGKPFRAASPHDAIQAGVYLVPEDRKRTGLVLEAAICENICLADLAAVSRNGLVSQSAVKARAEDQRIKLGIRTTDVMRRTAELSGGNQQKVVLGKWLSMRPALVIFDEPTRGIDVASKAEIYRLMRALTNAGVGVLMISSDMEEVIGVSDRIVVLREGEIAGSLSRPEFSEHNVLKLAVGAN